MSRKVALNFAILPFRRCKRPCEADAVVTGGVLPSVIYSYAARVRRNELRPNHRRKRDALTVKSAAVLCCAPKRMPPFFSHKRAITFERLYTGTKVFLCPPVHILMISLPICSALFAVIECAQPPVPRLPRRRRCLCSARREDADGCSLLVVKTLMTALSLPRRRRWLFSTRREDIDDCSQLAAKTSMPVHRLPAPTCHDDMHAWLCACTLPRCHRRPPIRLISPRCYLCLSAYLRLLGSHRYPRNAGIRADLLCSTSATSH